jgi:hypothetical protein
MEKLTRGAGTKLTASIYRGLETKAKARGQTIGEYIRSLITRDVTGDNDELILRLLCSLDQWIYEAFSASLARKPMTMTDLDGMRNRAMSVAGALAQMRGQQFRQPAKGAKA